jgi:hypothetical protein
LIYDLFRAGERNGWLAEQPMPVDDWELMKLDMVDSSPERDLSVP